MEAEYKAIDLEICIETLDQALVAHEGGADRVEICSRLDLDGLTPDLETGNQICEQTQIDVMVMIRSRSGDFVYADSEIEEMVETIAAFRSLPITGFVFGGLTVQGEIDIAALQKIRHATEGFELTFHRAFDYVMDPIVAIDQLIDAGVDRVLTSGRPGRAIDHLDTIKAITNHAAGRILIMAGGGVMPENAELILQTGVHELHASLNVKGMEYGARKKVQALSTICQSENAARQQDDQLISFLSKRLRQAQIDTSVPKTIDEIADEIIARKRK